MNKSFVVIASLFVIGVLVGTLMPLAFAGDDHSIERFFEMRADLQHEQREQGQYRCCLERPCTYCLEKTPGHGEGAACTCLDDVVAGKHPCGECMGEILEGHGSPYLSEYFAASITEEVGCEHHETMQRIIEQKYDRPVEEQQLPEGSCPIA